MQGFLLKKSLPHLLKYNPSFTCTEVHLIAVDFFFFCAADLGINSMC